MLAGWAYAADNDDDKGLTIQGVSSTQGVSVLKVTLEWPAVSENTDGTPITDLAGYKICQSAQSIPETPPYPTSPTDPAIVDCSQIVNETKTTGKVQVQRVPCNTPELGCYFRVRAFDTHGNESTLSNEVHAAGIVTPPPTGDPVNVPKSVILKLMNAIAEP